MNSILVSNHINWELAYEDWEPRKETCSSTASCLILTTVVWPIFFAMGALMLVDRSFSYFKARWNQHKIINILSDQKRLDDYSERRIAWCEQQIKDQKSYAIYIIERHLKTSNKIGFTIPQRNAFKGCFSSERTKRDWKDFQWDDFSKTDFFQKSNAPNTSDKENFQNLEEVRIKMKFLYAQKKILENPSDKAEAIKQIAKMSFVKNAFKRQESKEQIVRSIIWLLPSGLFWSLFFNSSTNARSTYEQNKNFLPAARHLQKYTDLIDAHNKLVRKNNFVVPYIKKII